MAFLAALAMEATRAAQADLRREPQRYALAPLAPRPGESAGPVQAAEDSAVPVRPIAHAWSRPVVNAGGGLLRVERIDLPPPAAAA